MKQLLEDQYDLTAKHAENAKKKQAEFGRSY